MEPKPEIRANDARDQLIDNGIICEYCESASNENCNEETVENCPLLYEIERQFYKYRKEN